MHNASPPTITFCWLFPYHVEIPPNIPLNQFDILPIIVGSAFLLNFIVYVFVSSCSVASVPSSCASTVTLFLTVIVIMFSPSFKESAPLISIVAPSILASASISKLFTQYSKVSIEYSYMLDINYGVSGNSTTSPF